MRVSLSHKFVVGALVVGGAVAGFPTLLASTGLAVAPWAAPFVALGVGGAIGFGLSRTLTRTFQELHRAADRISRGGLTARVSAPVHALFPDETDAFAASVSRMVEESHE